MATHDGFEQMARWAHLGHMVYDFFGDQPADYHGEHDYGLDYHHFCALLDRSGASQFQYPRKLVTAMESFDRGAHLEENPF